MLKAIIAVISCIVIAICLGIFILIKLIIHFKETEIRNKNLIRLAVIIVLTIILSGVNTFLLIKFSLDKLNTGIDNVSLPITSESTYKPVSEIPNAVIIGRIDTDFFINVAGNSKTARQQIDRMAYIELLRAAEVKYSDFENIDIAEITWVYSETESDFFVSEPVLYSAMGKVIKYDSAK